MILFFISIVFKVIQALVLLNVILSFIMPYERNEFKTIVSNLTEPLLKYFRVIIPVGSFGFDLAPMLLLFLLEFAERVLIAILS